MHPLTHCLNLLKEKGIRHSHSIHPAAQTAAAIASAERIPAHEMVKTVIYCSEKGYGMLLLPANRTVDFSEVQRVLDVSLIRLADEGELAQLYPDSEMGAMPPFGNSYDVPVLMDEVLADREFMAFSAGTHRDIIRMSTRDFKRLVKPQIASFAVKEALV
jgi:Ala-tRNA(Pro) deacylase